MSEWRQFRVLYRDFLTSLIDLEVFAADGEIQNLLGQFAALLAAFSFILVIYFQPRRPRIPATWGYEEFLMGCTIAVVGAFTVLAWNALLPERRDAFVLAPLPIRLRTIFLAKTAAVASALGCSIVAVNVFTGLTYPLALGASNGLSGIVRPLLAYWITAAAAGLFVFCALLAAQGLLSQFFSYRIFLQVSGLVQLLALALILGMFFLRPAFATRDGLAATEKQLLLKCLPSYWFLGLFERLNGSHDPVFVALAQRAILNLSIALTVASVTYAMAWQRNIRRIAEQPDIAPGSRFRPGARLATWLANKLIPRPLDRAIFLFVARTLARSRQHRLIVAAFAGVGIPLALAFVKSFLMANDRYGWSQPSPSMLAAGTVLLIFGVLGMRAVFSLPLALPANWIFRNTMVHPSAAYLAAVRKILYTMAAFPVTMAIVLACFTVWPSGTALKHTIVLALSSALLVECSLHLYRKIPFTCSYSPGSADLKIKFGVYALLFLVAVSAGSALEFWAMKRPIRFAIYAGLLTTVAILARRRTTEFAASPYNELQFEESIEPAVSPLVL